MAQQRHKAASYSAVWEGSTGGGRLGDLEEGEDGSSISVSSSPSGGLGGRRGSGTSATSSVGTASYSLGGFLQRVVLFYRRSPRKAIYTAFGLFVCFVLLAFVTVESGRGAEKSVVPGGYPAPAANVPVAQVPEPSYQRGKREGEDPITAAKMQAEIERKREREKQQKQQGHQQQQQPPAEAPAEPQKPADAREPAPPAKQQELPLPFEIIPDHEKDRRLQALPWPHGYSAHPNPLLPGSSSGLSPSSSASPSSSPRVKDLMVSRDRAQQLEAEIAQGGDGEGERGIPLSWTLTSRQACDIELLLSGGFSPLFGFMDRPTYLSVVDTQRLPKDYSRRALLAGATLPTPTDANGAVISAPAPANGVGDNALWPMPITLDLPESFVTGYAGLKKLLDQSAAESAGSSIATTARPVKIALRDQYHNLIAVLHATSVFVPDKVREAQAVFGTTDKSHPGVQYLFEQAGPIYAGGVLEGISFPQHFDYPALRFTPNQVREKIVAMGWPRTVAFQTRNPMHRAHIELTKRAQVEGKAGLLLQPVVGMTKPGDVEASIRVRCYQAIIEGKRHYNSEKGVILALLPLAMRMAGPVEALWHAIIRKNHGASHFIVGRDHAGCKDAAGKDFYGAYDAQTLVKKHEQELGISILTFQEVEYVPSLDQYIPGDQIPKGTETLSISGTKFRGMMAKGDPIPAWYSDPAVIEILREVSPPLNKRGFALLFTGLSGGGKTTIAHGLISRLGALAPTRRLTFLDGDVVRTHLSKGLGFSLQDRNTNVERIGFVAAEAVKHGGIVLAAPIAPLHEARKNFKKHVTSNNGGFFQIYVASSLKTCAKRDVKGLYEIAAAGKTDLTGVSHPYEMPLGDDGFPVDLTLDTQGMSVDESVSAVVVLLLKNGYLDATDEKVKRELTDGERALLQKLEAADAASKKKKDEPAAGTAAAGTGTGTGTNLHPYASRLAPYFTASAKDVATAVGPLAPLTSAAASASSPSSSSSAAAAGKDRGFCTRDWDLMMIDKAGQAEPVTMYGGLPMQSSLAFHTLKTSAPAAVPSNVALFLAPYVSVAGVAGVQTLNPVYLSALHAVAQVGSADEAVAKVTASSLLSKADTAATLVSAAPPAGNGTSAAAAVPSTTTATSVLDLVLSPGSRPASTSENALPVLGPQASRVYAGWDLWSRMRWNNAGSATATAGAAAAGPAKAGEERPLAVFAPLASAAGNLPLVTSLVPHVFRFDPCFRAAAVVGAAAPASVSAPAAPAPAPADGAPAPATATATASDAAPALALEAAYRQLLGAPAKASATKVQAKASLKAAADALLATIRKENDALRSAVTQLGLASTFSIASKRFLLVELSGSQEAAHFFSLQLEQEHGAQGGATTSNALTEAYRELLQEEAAAATAAASPSSAATSPTAGAKGSSEDRHQAEQLFASLTEFLSAP